MAISTREMVLTELGGAEISMDEARAMVRSYRRSAPPDAERAGTYDRVHFDKILAQPGCVGIRFFHALHEDGSPTIVIIGIDEHGRPVAGGPIQNHLPCPPNCFGEDLV
ncbi:MAG TPA: hypothetical protein VLD17_08110 [Gemmatimonadaceae bacterium]|nr:hypothetical protein [Gemmatimonadaceae bacterium]